MLLKNNVKAEWSRAVLQERDDMVALDAAILMHPRTWEASGHLESFTDPLVQCTGECKKRWRADDIEPGEGASWAIGWVAEGDIFADSHVNLIPTRSGGTHEAGFR